MISSSYGTGTFVNQDIAELQELKLNLYQVPHQKSIKGDKNSKKKMQKNANTSSTKSLKTKPSKVLQTVNSNQIMLLETDDYGQDEQKKLQQSNRDYIRNRVSTMMSQLSKENLKCVSMTDRNVQSEHLLSKQSSIHHSKQTSPKKRPSYRPRKPSQNLSQSYSGSNFQPSPEKKSEQFKCSFSSNNKATQKSQQISARQSFDIWGGQQQVMPQQDEISMLKQFLQEISLKENEIIEHINQQQTPIQQQRTEEMTFEQIISEKGGIVNNIFSCEEIQPQIDNELLFSLQEQIDVLRKENEQKDLIIQEIKQRQDDLLIEKQQQINYLMLKIGLLEKENAQLKIDSATRALAQCAQTQTDFQQIQYTETILKSCLKNSQQENCNNYYGRNIPQQQYSLSKASDHQMTDQSKSVITPQSQMETPTRSALMNILQSSVSKAISSQEIQLKQHQQYLLNESQINTFQQTLQKQIQGNGSFGNTINVIDEDIPLRQPELNPQRDEIRVELKNPEIILICKQSNQQIEKKELKQPTQIACSFSANSSKPSTMNSSQNFHQQSLTQPQKTSFNQQKQIQSSASQPYISPLKDLTPVRQSRQGNQQYQTKYENSIDSKRSIASSKQTILSQYTTKNTAQLEQNKKQKVQPSMITNFSIKTLARSDSENSIGRATSSNYKSQLKKYQTNNQQNSKTATPNESNYSSYATPSKNTPNKTTINQSSSTVYFNQQPPQITQQDIDKVEMENPHLARKMKMQLQRQLQINQKVTAKEEKRQELKMKRDGDKQIREKSYEARMNMFKSQVQERRRNLSKTPVKQGGQTEDDLDNDEQTLFIVNTPILKDDQSRRQLEIMRRVKGEEDDMEPQPLNVQITPIRRE